MNFALSGAGGAAKSTKDGKVYVLQHFCCFLDLHGGNVSAISFTVDPTDPNHASHFENELCVVTLWQKFGNYLTVHAVHMYNLVNLGAGTALQYFSGAKDSVKEMFPNNEIWIGHSVENIVPGKRAW